MKKIVHAGSDAQAEAIAGLIADYVRKTPDALLCFAAGDTGTATYARMAQMQREGLADFRQCRLVGLDEWVGLKESEVGSCKRYIEENVIRPLELKRENITFFDACAQDLRRECDIVNRFLEDNGPIDISLMGVGMNGHIALNEPGCDFTRDAHTVPLSDTTKRVAVKYFHRETPVTEGITLGMKQIWASKLLIVMANMERKRSIMHEAMYGEVTNRVPASYLQIHPNCIVSVDEAADS